MKIFGTKLNKEDILLGSLLGVLQVMSIKAGLEAKAYPLTINNWGSIKKLKKGGDKKVTEETYDANVICMNCGNRDTLKIKEGVTIREECEEINCSNCGCTEYTASMNQPAYII